MSQIVYLLKIKHRNGRLYLGIQVGADNVDSDQTAPKEQSDLGLQCLPFCINLLICYWPKNIKNLLNFRQKKINKATDYSVPILNIRAIIYYDTCP